MATKTTLLVLADPRYLSDQGGCWVARNGSLVQTAVGRPGANDWCEEGALIGPPHSRALSPLACDRYTTPDPITLLGDYTPWANVSISVAAFLPQALPPAATPAAPGDDPNANVETCEPAPGAQSAQVWTFGSPAAGYISNSVTGVSTCLNLYGCMPRLIYYECCLECGCYNGEGFVFELLPNGSLVAPLLPGQCAGVLGDNTTVSMVPCAASPAQHWTHTGTGQLVNAAGGGCLTSQLVPQYPYVRVCIRVTAYSGFAGLAPVPGYCLQLNDNGAWAVTAGNTTLASGTVPDFVPSARQALSLSAQGTSIAGAVGSAALGPWESSAFAAGMVALGSGVHAAAFDDLVVAAL